MTSLSITTDYLENIENAESYLERISQVGFTHIHWCHNWNTDFMYSNQEISQIAKWLKMYNLQMLDVHASAGNKKSWVSFKEDERRAGIALVKNRIDMAHQLSCEVIILHFPREPNEKSLKKDYWKGLHKSLGELQEYTKTKNVKIALENYGDKEKEIIKLLKAYSPNFLGLCYDSGHGNLDGHKFNILKAAKDRLISIHLHDNDGKIDKHNIPFTGTINWNKLAKLLAKSSYSKCMNLEVHMRHSGIQDEQLFLNQAYKAGLRLTKMVEDYSKNI